MLAVVVSGSHGRHCKAIVMTLQLLTYECHYKSITLYLWSERSFTSPRWSDGRQTDQGTGVGGAGAGRSAGRPLARVLALVPEQVPGHAGPTGLHLPRLRRAPGAVQAH